MMAIEDWSPVLKFNLEKIDGVRQVHNPDELPNVIMANPSLLIIPQSQAAMWSVAGPNITVHQILLALFTTAQINAESHGRLNHFVPLVRNRLAANLMLGALVWGGDVAGGGGHVEHVLPMNPPEPWVEGPDAFTYFDKLYLGIMFRIEVKETEAVTVDV